MGDDAVHGWLELVRRRIAEPLGMTDTFVCDQDASNASGPR